MRTFREIRAQYAEEGRHHCLRLVCSRCGDVMTCRCSTPKTEEIGVCLICESATRTASLAVRAALEKKNGDALSGGFDIVRKFQEKELKKQKRNKKKKADEESEHWPKGVYESGFELAHDWMKDRKKNNPGKK